MTYVIIYAAVCVALCAGSVLFNINTKKVVAASVFWPAAPLVVLVMWLIDVRNCLRHARRLAAIRDETRTTP